MQKTLIAVPPKHLRCDNVVIEERVKIIKTVGLS